MFTYLFSKVSWIIFKRLHWFLCDMIKASVSDSKSHSLFPYRESYSCDLLLQELHCGDELSGSKDKGNEWNKGMHLQLSQYFVKSLQLWAVLWICNHEVYQHCDQHNFLLAHFFHALWHMYKFVLRCKIFIGLILKRERDNQTQDLSLHFFHTSIHL